MFRVVTKFCGKIIISTQLTRIPDKTGMGTLDFP